MSEQTSQSYQNLIQLLLNCPIGKETDILQANSSLIDWTLVQLLKMGSAIMARRRDLKTAARLKKLAVQVSAILEKYGNFLNEVMLATTEKNKSQAIYSLLEKNLDKLDDNLRYILQNWARATLPEFGKQERCILAEAIGNFSNHLLDFSLGNRACNLEIAIAGYEIVAEVYNRKAFPQVWATTQYNLGEAYRNRIKGEVKENLELAIAFSQAALEEFPRQSFPVQWARIQNNLAAAYSCRIKGEGRENLEKAIECFQAVLEEFPRESFPNEWAKTQNNLGNAYLRNASLSRNTEERSENLEKALACFQAALDTLPRQSFPVECAMTHNHLGIAYSSRIEGEPGENLEKAIAHFEAAIEERTRHRFPIDWAITQHNLGNAYLYRIEGDRRENLEKALTHFQAALEVHTRQDIPVQWAATQRSLCEIYRANDQIDNAIQALQLALKIYTPTAFPIESFKTGYQLGSIAFAASEWEVAIKGYEAAITSVEQSRNWATTDERRQEILTEAIGAYERMMQCCINTGKLEKALETVERFRSKRLLDLIAANELYKDGEIPLDVQQLLNRYEELQQQINQERFSNNSNTSKEWIAERSTRQDRIALKVSNQKIIDWEDEQKRILEQIRRKQYPLLAAGKQVKQLDLAAIQKLVEDSKTAILNFYSSENDTFVFIVRQNQISLHTCVGQGLKTLNEWIISNWLIPYAISSDQKKEELKQIRMLWFSHMISFLAELAQRLQLNNLITTHLTDIEELIIVPNLFLYQIPFAALPLGESQFLGDRFRIRYIPSCQILEICRDRQQQNPVSETLIYGIVENATEDLPFASFEAEQIAQLHNIPDRQRLRGHQATKQEYRQLAKQVQAIHSSHHAESRLDNPLKSELKLANDNITLGELLSPRWRLPNLSDVFLSCCETNLGVSDITDNILTLASGFLCAGARSVLSTLWSVDDLATALFAIIYYQYRQQGKSRPESLQQAQIKLRSLKKEELLGRGDIQELYRQAVAGRKEARSKRSQYQADSAEYLKWDREYRKYARVTIEIEKLKTSPNSEPFSEPRYWAAFTYQGLR